MGKDREGTYHPAKGKPSAGGTQKGIVTTNSSTLDQQLEIEDKYDIQSDAEILAANVYVRHPNRNVDKGEERKVNNSKRMSLSTSISETFNSVVEDVTIEELSPFLSKEALQALGDYTAECCVTIYLPRQRVDENVNEQIDVLAFKNVLQQVEALLRNRGTDQAVINKIMMPAKELLRDENLWRESFEGLAVFLSESFAKFMKLPNAPIESTLINTSFFITPLVSLLLSTEYFFLLTISKKQAKLFRADNFGMKYIAVKELPDGVDDVVHFEEKADQTLFRTGSSGAGEGANFHGIGGGKPDEKDNISMYLQEVDNTLWKEVLHNETVPLLLAGVEYLLPLFRKVSNYQHIWEKSITGNVEFADNDSLFKNAREIMDPYFRQSLEKAKALYGNQSATALTSTKVEDIIPASYYSRIAKLFVQKDEQVWGTFDEKENKLVLHSSQKENDDSLLDKAVLKTILNGGEVFIVDKADMPAPSPMAALMRY